jgi:BlaI family transcriptional regulator, penicillinase repressor
MKRERPPTKGRRALPQLAPAELEVMKVLWAAGGLSGREVHDRLAEPTGWAYSTARTTIERMVKKGLVARRTFHGLHVYEPAISRAQGMARLVHEFASRVLGLSHAPVAALFRESEALTPAEIAELRALLRRQKKGGD